jgi:hypothetical protein
MRESVRKSIYLLPICVALIASPSLAQDEKRGGRDGGAKVERDTDRGDRSRGSDAYDRRAKDGDRQDRGDRADRRRGDGYDGPRRRWSDRDGRRGWRSGRRYNWGPGFAFYLYDGYYYGDCSWLRRRAIATDSRLWWNRYRRCRDAV